MQICALLGYIIHVKPSKRAQGWSTVPCCYSPSGDLDRNGSVLVCVAILHLSCAYFSPFKPLRQGAHHNP